MRFPIFAAFALAACGAAGQRADTTPTIPVTHTPSEAPAHDLATEKADAKPGDAASGVAASAGKDPRVVDLDIIRITASTKGIGGDVTAEHVATIATLRDLIKTYPDARESIDGHLYIAALQADHSQWPAALTTLDEVLARSNLTYSDRVEAFARRGYIMIEQHDFAHAEVALDAAVAEWRRAPHIDDPYYIAMATYYRGELAHRKFTEAPVRLPDDVLIADLDQKRVLAVQAYDRWKDSLHFHQAYWATAAGYQMSQIFVELWEITVTAPYPKRIDADTRQKYIVDVHDRVREHLAKALEGHRMNVELAKAYGVDTQWSQGSAQRAVQIVDMLAKDTAGQFVTPAN